MTKPILPSPRIKALKYLGADDASVSAHQQALGQRPFHLLPLGPDAPDDVAAAWRIARDLHAWQHEVAKKHEGERDPLQRAESEIAGQLGIGGTTLRKAISGSRWLRFEALAALARTRPQAALEMFPADHRARLASP